MGSHAPIAQRIASAHAAGDTAALAVLSIELLAALSVAESRLDALQTTIADRDAADDARRAAEARRKREARGGLPRTSEDVRGHDGTSTPAAGPLPQVPLLPPTPPNNSSFPNPASSSSAADDAALLDAEQRLRGRLDGRGDEIVLRFLGRAGSATRRAAWVGRLGALMDSAPHFTPAELAEGLEALMTEPEESWKPSVLKAWVRRVRTDAEKEQQRPARTASNGAKPSSADDAGAGAVFAKIRGLINTASVAGQPSRKFIRRADVEALGPRVLTAYDNIGGADRFLDPDEQVGFVLRDFTREYGTLHGAAP